MSTEVRPSEKQLCFPAVLDACCGPRMMWFDSADKRALFIDKRQETYAVDIGTPGTVGRAPIVVAPDVVADFTRMPFADETFSVVVFDPPHFAKQHGGRLKGIMARKYGFLPVDWQETLRRGFQECFRVLKPRGLLVFKWAELYFTLSQVLELTPHKPLFGHRSGVRATTHWCVFLKESA
jgi:SAM-dependent methyltransferase